MLGSRPVLLDRRHRCVRVDVACTGAVAQLADRVANVRVLVLLVRPWFEVVRMTTCTIGLERGVAPVDGFGVVLVAIGTEQWVAMVQRLVGQPHVPVCMWNPRDAVVTDVAFLLCDEVPRILARCNDAVMAGRARPQYLGMVDPDYGAPRGRAMTVFAHICRQRMRRPFASRVQTIVTTDAVTGDGRMIEVRRNPGDGRMTIIAVVAARDVVWVLAFRDRAVVTRGAGSEYL